MKKFGLFSSALLAGLLLAGCDSSCCQDVVLTKSIKVAGNQTPIPVITGIPAKSACGIVLDGSGTKSSDPDGTIVSYQWTLDGIDVNAGDNVSATLPCDGKNHKICLTVTDDKGASQTTCQTIYVIQDQPQPQPQPQPQDKCDTLDPKITFEKADAMQYKFSCETSTYKGNQIDAAIAAGCEWNAHKTFKDGTSYDHGTTGPVKWINVDPATFKALDLTLTVNTGECKKTITEHYIIPDDLPY